MNIIDTMLRTIFSYIKVCILGLYLFFLTIIPIHSQNQRIRFKNITIESGGLTHNGISLLYQDRFGFIWIGNGAGLSRYDGYEFEEFKSDARKTNSLVNDICSSILEDSKGFFWLGTDNGFTRFDVEQTIFKKFTSYTINGISHSISNVIAIVEDTNGFIWIGQQDGLLKFNPFTESFEKIETPKVIISQLLKDSENNFWIGTNNGLYKFNPTNSVDSFESIISSIDINILTFNKNYLYVLTNENLFTYSISKNQINPYPIEFNKIDISTIKTILPIKKQLYIGTTKGLIILDSNRFSNYTHDPIDNSSLGSNAINQLMVDRSGLVWIGTQNGGISLLDHKAQLFDTYFIKNFKNKDINKLDVFSIYEDHFQRLWIGTYDNGIFIFDRKNKIVQNVPLDEHLQNGVSNNMAGVMCEINPGIIWVGTWQMGITQIKIKDKQKNELTWVRNVKGNPYSLNGWSIRSIIKSKKDGNIWIGSIDEGIERYDIKTNRFIHLLDASNAPLNQISRRIWTLYEDRSGMIWAGTQDKGVYKIDYEKKTFVNYTINFSDTNSLNSTSVRSIFETENGMIWIGHSGEGLDRLNPKTNKIKHYGKSEGLSNQVIWSITNDPLGKLWLSTDNGLVLFDPKTEKFENYYGSDGLQSSQFNFGAYCKTKKGELVYGGINGFSIVNPYSIPKNQLNDTVVITKLKIYNTVIKSNTKHNKRQILSKEIFATKSIQLSYLDRIFSLEFSSMNFSNPEKALFAYKMEGFDDDWIYTTAKQRIATYTNLEPGNYIFKVKSVNSTEKLKDNVTSLEVIITPPFWKTVWFQILLYTVLVLLAIAFYWFRIYSIKKQNKLLQKLVLERTTEIQRQNQELINLNATKDKFFSIISHDLKNPFQGILTLSELLISDFKTSTDSQKINILEHIKKSSDRAYELLQNLLHWAQTQTNTIHFEPISINLKDIILQSIEVYLVNADKKRIEIDVQVSKNLTVFCDPNMLATVIRNLVSNAIKFTQEHGKIKIVATKETNFVKVEITDSGVGIPEEMIEKIFKIEHQTSTKGTSGETGSGLGLIITKEFIELNKGELIVRKNAIGSTFGFTVPISKEKVIEFKQNEFATSTNKTEIENTELSIEKSNDRPCIVIVEDNPEIRLSLVLYLQTNYTIYEAENGAIGLNIIKKINPDLIISDVMMPEMNGFELCTLVKKDEKISHIPIILLTAQNDYEHQHEGLDKGADDYLTKPFNPSLLEVRIKNLIKSRNEIKLRFRTELTLQPKDIIISAVDGDFLKRAIELIEQNIDNSEFDVEQFIHEMGVGRTHFYEKIKNLTDLSPAEFIRMIRLKRAAQLLSDKSKTIAEVTFMVGFNDIKNFRKLFKSHFGMTPSEYIQEHYE